MVTKAVYRQYADAAFSRRVPPPAASQGLLGPTLAVEVGDTLEIVFRNSLPFAVNLALDGGLEALLLPGGGGGSGSSADPSAAAVAPGATVTYRYRVPDRCRALQPQPCLKYILQAGSKIQSQITLPSLPLAPTYPTAPLPLPQRRPRA